MRIREKNASARIGAAIIKAVSLLVIGHAAKIELLLTRFEPPPVVIHAVWPATRVLPARTQRFIDFPATRLKKERL